MTRHSLRVKGIAIAVLVIGLALYISTEKTYAKVITVPDDYSTIQQAIDASSPGDVILVRRGVYFENIDIKNKHNIVIKSIDGAENTIIIAKLGTVPVLKLDNCTNITIDGFTIAKASAYRTAGILVISSRNITVVNNIIVDNNAGVWVDYSSDLLIANNTIARNSYGVRIRYSSNITVCCNNVIGNYNGIEAIDSKNLTVFFNNFVRNIKDVYTLKTSDVKWYREGLGGNYWSNTTGYSGSVYVIDSENLDLYPLTSPRIPIPIAIPLIYITTVTYTTTVIQSSIEVTHIVAVIIVLLVAIAFYVHTRRRGKKIQTRRDKKSKR